MKPNNRRKNNQINTNTIELSRRYRHPECPLKSQLVRLLTTVVSFTDGAHTRTHTAAAAVQMCERRRNRGTAEGGRMEKVGRLLYILLPLKKMNNKKQQMCKSQRKRHLGSPSLFFSLSHTFHQLCKVRKWRMLLAF